MKLCIDHVDKNPKKKMQNFDFSICKIVLVKKKIASEIFFWIFFIRLLCISEEASWWVDLRTENQIKNFQILTEL